MSLFIAVRLPESIQEKIDNTFHDESIPEELWQRREDLHITLLFIKKGVPQNTYLESVKERWKKFSFSPFTLRISRPNLWTRRESYQIFHLQVAQSNELISIQSNIVSLFPEVRKSIHEFTPHISLLRSTEISQSNVEKLNKKFSQFSTDEFLVNQIHLYVGEKDSENNKGNRYRILM